MSIKDKIGKYRRKSNIRIIVIALLLVVVGVLFYFWKSARIALIIAFIALLTALGLETTGNDFDIGTLLKTGSFQESKLDKTDNGTWLIGEECQKEKFNCSNFQYQEDAQDLFEKCGGIENDVNGLDRDNDGKVCEALPSKSKK